MLRLVVFVILLIVVILAVRAIVAPRSEKDDDSDSRDMVEDPNCHVFIPKTEAVKKEIQGKDHFFCSEKCAEEYQSFARKN